jgi:hypothetical protein
MRVVASPSMPSRKLRSRRPSLYQDQVTDDGLDGAAASPFAANGRGDDAAPPGNEHTSLVGVVATVAAIDTVRRATPPVRLLA